MTDGLKEVLDFMHKAGIFFLATVDGTQARVRPFGFVMEHDGKAMFCLGNFKDVYKQLKACPNAEISCCGADPDGGDRPLTLRLTGSARFITSPETQKKALDFMPALGGMYSVGDGKFELFVLDSAKAVFSKMTGEKREISL